jgi:hypothetical protein
MEKMLDVQFLERLKSERDDRQMDVVLKLTAIATMLAVVVRNSCHRFAPWDPNLLRPIRRHLHEVVIDNPRRHGDVLPQLLVGVLSRRDFVQFSVSLPAQPLASTPLALRVRHRAGLFN